MAWVIRFMDLGEKVPCRSVRGADDKVEVEDGSWDEEMRLWMVVDSARRGREQVVNRM